MSGSFFAAAPSPRASYPQKRCASVLPGRNPMNLRLQDISRRMVANVPDLLTDLVEIATYVLRADEAISRGATREAHWAPPGAGIFGS